MVRQVLDNVDADVLIERLKRAAGVSSDTALSRALGLSHGAVHHWRRKGTLPVDRVVSLADKLPNVSIEWLLTGRGSAKNAPLSIRDINAELERFDPDILRIAMKEASDVADEVTSTPPMPIYDLSPIVIRFYYRAEGLVNSLCSSDTMTREQAIIALERAAGLPPAPVSEEQHLLRASRKVGWPTSYTRQESLRSRALSRQKVISSAESEQSD